MKKQVLVVDDDSSVRESLKRVLEVAGYQVKLGVDGSEAAAQLQNDDVDLLVLDLNMPNRDGWDVLEHVGMVHPLLPVIMITGLAAQLDTTRIPGVSALLEKPIDVSVMLQTIEDLLAESMEDRLRRIELWSGTEPSRHLIEPMFKNPVRLSHPPHRS